MTEFYDSFMFYLDQSIPAVRVLFIVALLLLYLLIYRLLKRVFNRISTKAEKEQSFAFKIQNQDIVSDEDATKIVLSAIRLVFLLVAIFIGFSFLNIALGLFEWSRELAAKLMTLTWDSIGYVFQKLIDYLPDLLVIIVVLLVVRFVLHVIRLIFKGIGNGRIQIPGFYREWSRTSFNLVRVLIYALTFVVIFPYLPGSDSPAFQGLSLFLGLLLSLGSTTAIANVVAGIVLTYTRAFTVGDRISIDNTIGVVVERGMFVTRLKNTKNEIISVPNSMSLSSHIINYSEQARGPGLFLYTSVTIGYDVPWQKVHELLIGAALATDKIEAEPEPYVLQKSLDDYSINYQLNATTRDAIAMPRTHSNMNANILDAFNKAGLEIMSPMFVATRDGSELTLPPEE